MRVVGDYSTFEPHLHCAVSSQEAAGAPRGTREQSGKAPGCGRVESLRERTSRTRDGRISGRASRGAAEPGSGQLSAANRDPHILVSRS